MIKANAEQRAAIETEGGVLLEAGAGSGKTTVIVQHLIKKIHVFLNDFSSHINFESELDKFLGGIVVMTFTKKAAGELKIRLKKEFDNLCHDSIDQDLSSNVSAYELVRDKSSLIFVGTIDSFCKKIVGEDSFPYPLVYPQVLDELQVRELMHEALLNWGERYFSIEDNGRKNFKNFFLTQMPSLVLSLSSIFVDPMKRIKWLERNISEQDFSEVICKIFSRFESMLQISSDSLEIDTSKKAGEFLEAFQTLGLETIDYSSLKKLNDFFADFPRFPVYKGNNEINKILLKELKDLRQILKESYENIDYICSHENEYIKWSSFFKTMFAEVNKFLAQHSGFNFADIAFQTLRSLDDQKFCQMLMAKYSYFIIDEFQDTSFLQFEIVKKITGNKLDCLFLVGDVKQAIYGFRGGDIDLFLESMKKMPNILQMEMNYRSSKEIVDFNNQVFDLLNKEYGFSELEFLKQKSSKELCGEIQLLSMNESSSIDRKMNTDEINYLEAELIVEYLKKRETSKSIVVLYRNLTPSIYLLSLLEKEKISFKSQYKMPLSDCPMFGMFEVLCMKLKNINEEIKTQEGLDYLLNKYIKILDANLSKVDVDYFVQGWHTDCTYLGFFHAFVKFYKNLGVFSDKFSPSISKIKTISELSQNNIESALRLIKKVEKDKLNYEYQFGDENSVKIMTVHASKGLEFDTVIMAGMYTNSPLTDRLNVLGNEPMNFKWQAQNQQIYLSLNQLEEKYSVERRDLREELRLMYVAFTRAEKNIVFMKLHNDIKPKNRSWADIISTLDLYSIGAKELIFDLELEGQTIKKRALFHEDSEIKLFKNNNITSFSYSPELSVTSIVSWLKCNEFFYLKHIYKLSEDYFKRSKREVLTTENVETKASHSSAGRGIKLHDEMEDYVKVGDFHSQSKFGWLGKILGKIYQDHEVKTEYELKFESGGQIISGTPDLVLLPLKKSEPVRIWDYKTGNVHESVEESYFYQLLFYALGVSSEFVNIDEQTVFELSVVYLDLEVIKSKTLNLKEIKSIIKKFWSGFMIKPTKNNKHCDLCNYNNICRLSP